MYGTRQAGPAQSDPRRRRHRDLPRVGVRGVRAGGRGGRGRARDSARRAPPSGRAASSTRPSALGESLGLGGLAYIVAARDAEGAAGQVSARRAPAAAVRGGRASKPGDAVFFASGPAKSLDAAGRRPADAPRPRARPARGERVPLLLGHRFPVLRARSRDRARSPSATTRSRCRRAASRR